MPKVRLARVVSLSLAVALVCAVSGATAAATVKTKSAKAKHTTTTKRTTTQRKTVDVTALATNLTLTAGAKSVWLSTNTTVSGVLTASDTSTDPPSAQPLPNEPVQLQTASTATQWVVIATVTTDSNGAFNSQVTINSASATFRAVFAGNSNYTASQSPNLQIMGFKAASVLHNTSPSTVRAESGTTYSAHYVVDDNRIAGHPAVTGATINVYRRDTFGGDWTHEAQLVTNNNGNVSWRAKVSTPTEWKLVPTGTDRSINAKTITFKPHVTPLGKVYKLPAAAPKPTYLPPQPAAVGAGANPVVGGISNQLWNFMVGKSWHNGCPVGRNQLAHMSINYWGFDGYRHRGELVFNANHKGEFVNAFKRMYNDHIPLHGMYLVDRYGHSSVTNGADDYASMEHDNTSAFNCRWVDGSPGTLSPHAYGTAVDINPYENPYHSAKGWTPNYWWRQHSFPPYTWRSSNDTLVRDMRAAGFNWTYANEDSQHFDAR